ncbi:MAG: hypothetical protein K1X86_09190 [Ignavibacteria bacterium]|nr:hypothetical protein [Ignavibacteria bacterium]
MPKPQLPQNNSETSIPSLVSYQLSSFVFSGIRETNIMKLELRNEFDFF